MKPKHVFVGIFVFIAAMFVYAQYESFQREEKDRQLLIEIQKKEAAKPPIPAPVPAPAKPVTVKQLPSVTIAGTTLKTGMSWDDALPTLQKGERVSLERPDADSFVDVRSFDGQVYRFSFHRSDGPYRLLTIIER